MERLGPVAAYQPVALAGLELLALQLSARGYSPEQIGRLLDRPPARVTTLLALAAASLGAADVAGSVREARRRGLIV